MKNTMPKTPFATRLSGSARETQLRLRSIFQWKKQRPPVWLFAAIIVVIFGCLGLVSCQPEKPEEPQTPAEENTPVEENASGDKYGDFFANYQTVFPAFTYQGLTEPTPDGLTMTLEDVPENEVEELLLAEYQHDRYQHVVIHTLDTLTESDFTPGGDFFTDKEFAEELLGELNAQVSARGLCEYTVVYVDVSWAYTPETLALGPQLGNGRYERLYLAGKIAGDAPWELVECFWGEYVLDRSNTVQNIQKRAALNRLYDNALIRDVSDAPEKTLLLAPSAEGRSFCAACFTEEDSYELVIGVWDADAGIEGAGGDLVGTVFRAANSGGTPKVAAYEWEGEQYLIYTANGMSQGFSGGQAGEIRLVDGQMNWEWPVSGDIRDSTSQSYHKYQDFWAENLALMSVNGLEIFTENEEYGLYEGSPQQWTRRGTITNYYMVEKSGNGMTDSDLKQVRAWLEEFGRNGNNAMDIKNDSASWRILEFERNGLTENCVLLCVGEFNEDFYLRARIQMDHLGQEPLEILDWEIGGVELTQYPVEVEKIYDIDIDETGKPVLTDFCENVYHANRAYFLGEEPGAPQEGDWRIDSVRFLGSEVTYETTGEAYLVRTSIYNTRMESAESQPVTKWWPVEQESYLVLGRAMDGELYEVRGERHDVREGVKRMILEESYGVDDWEVTLWHDDNPYPQPLSLGWWSDTPLRQVKGEPVIERLDGWEPIHWEGDYWERYTLEGLSILRRYSTMADKNNYVINNIELTRDDFSTPRGIKLGSTRAEVATAYPELKSGDYWSKYPGEDYLWYCEDEGDWGPALIFFFENDKVSKIVLNNMFN